MRICKKNKLSFTVKRLIALSLVIAVVGNNLKQIVSAEPGGKDPSNVSGSSSSEEKPGEQPTSDASRNCFNPDFLRAVCIITPGSPVQNQALNQNNAEKELTDEQQRQLGFPSVGRSQPTTTGANGSLYHRTEWTEEEREKLLDLSFGRRSSPDPEFAQPQESARNFLQVLATFIVWLFTSCFSGVLGSPKKD